MQYLAVRIADQQQIIANLVTVDSEQRLGQTLLRLARKLGKKDISSYSSSPTGDTATDGIGRIGIRKGARSCARRETEIAVEEEKFMKTTVGLRIDHRKAVIVFMTGRDEAKNALSPHVIFSLALMP